MTRTVAPGAPPVPTIPTHLRERQATASDPARSVWVSANAGSGKTHVLTQRVIRLLLRGTPPGRILCLTFTKAAATQMARRVFSTLSKWTMLEDTALKEAIMATGGPSPAPPELAMARRLFTRTIETPGGLKIQTIHAFCERLLHLFPLEANVPARFEVADERRTAELLAAARRAAVAAARGGSSLTLLTDIVGEQRLYDLLNDAMKLRAEARRIDPSVQDELAARLGLPGADAATLRRRLIEGGLTADDWERFADALAQGSPNDVKQAERLRTAARLYRQGDDPAEVVCAYRTVFFNADGTPRARLVTKASAGTYPDMAAALEAEKERVASLCDELKIAATVERTQALVELADAVMDRYDRVKTLLGLLDFDDLIERTLTLLERSDAGWVLHKLDAGIDHVLVDEAQDTSEAQWKILERLTAEFAAGAGASTVDRSFFVVGDEKQSIFSFQGAAPHMFDNMRRSFERRFKSGGKPFEQVLLKTSFRSVPGVLAAVDKMFTHEGHADGLVAATYDWPGHEAFKASLPGLVEIWPAVSAPEPAKPEDWTIPLDMPAESDPVALVAERIARKIKELIAPDSMERVHEGGARRPIRPGDVLILVRARGPFFEAMIRALKRHYIPVAGADRLDVGRHIAVMDLVTAGRAALLADDDLSLATLLKSPLFGFTDDDLLDLCPGRPGTLRAALEASDKPVYRDAVATLERWTARAAAATPFAFYIELLGRDGGRRRMEARLGPEAHDALDEFLRLALDHERRGAPSLKAFLDEIEGLDVSIKRDMEGPGDAVRVMTVHAAKGLEAKIVFLPDTCGLPPQQFAPCVFDLNKGRGAAPLIVWSPTKADDIPDVAAARAEEQTSRLREYRRLLYVALTRAEERLYLAGFYNKTEPSDESWQRMIARAFAEAEEIPAFWNPEERVRRIVSPGTVEPPDGRREPPVQPPLALTPAWLERPVPTQSRPAILRPSRPPLGAMGTGRLAAIAYGAALHQLLQHLPGVPRDRWAGAAAVFLDSRHAAVPAPAQAEIFAEARTVLEMAELAPLFSAEARAEVALIGRLAARDGSSREIRGSVDRLVVRADEIILADFKTGPVADRAPASYIEQVALYRRLVAALWPARRVRVLLVWTRAPRVDELAPDALEAAADRALG